MIDDPRVDPAIVAHTDQMIAHWWDRTVPADCDCEFCRIGQAIDRNGETQQERAAFARSMTRPQRVRITPVNRQWIK